MNKRETLQLLAILRASYPTEYMNLTVEEAQGVVSVWQTQFADISAGTVMLALNKCISTNKKAPTIADVKEKLKSVHWEALTMLEQSHNDDSITAEEVNTYKRIYHETECYKFPNRVEPSIHSMIGTNVKQIGGENK